MSDLEEGEIENDNETKEETMVVPTNNYNMLEQKSTKEIKSFEERPKAVPKYRTTARALKSSSESDSNGEEDTPLWRQKKEKYFRKHKDSAHAHCPSPTLPEFVPGSKNNSCSASSNKKANNVWGSVLQEQDLTQAMVQDSSLKRLPGYKHERTVESYDFTNKYNDTRPHLHQDMPEDEEGGKDSHDPFDKVLKSTVVKSRGREVIGYDDTLLDSGRNKTSRKRKFDNSDNQKSVRNRLGTKKVTTMEVGDLNISEDMEIKELAKHIAAYIHEPKVELIERVAENMGKDVAIRILNRTRDVEESGGMLTLDGSRRRTPGGVYLQLLKQQPEYSKEKYKLIFVEDHQWRSELNKQKKQRRKARRSKDSKKASVTPSKSDSADKIQEENMEDGEIPNSKLDSVSPGEQMDCGEKIKQDSQSRKSRSSSVNGNRGERVKSVDSRNENSKPKSRRSRSYSDQDEDEEDSDSSSLPGKSGEFDFQAELQAAKKLITKAKDKTSKEVEEMDEVADDLDDLDESNVVDIPLDD